MFANEDFLGRWATADAMVPNNTAWKRIQSLKDQGISVSKEMGVQEGKRQQCEKIFWGCVETGGVEIGMLTCAAMYAPSTVSAILLYASLTMILINQWLYNGFDAVYSYKRCFAAYNIPFVWLDCFITFAAFLLMCWFAHRFYKKNTVYKE